MQACISIIFNFLKAPYEYFLNFSFRDVFFIAQTSFSESGVISDLASWEFYKKHDTNILTKICVYEYDLIVDLRR